MFLLPGLHPAYFRVATNEKPIVPKSPSIDAWKFAEWKHLAGAIIFSNVWKYTDKSKWQLQNM